MRPEESLFMTLSPVPSYLSTRINDCDFRPVLSEKEGETFEGGNPEASYSSMRVSSSSPALST